MTKEVIPCIFYLYIFKKFSDKHESKIVKRKELLSYLHEWRIKKPIRNLIIKELEILGLIERVDFEKIKLIECDFNEEDLRKYYEELGIY